ncbi:MAG: ATP-binding cassette domain-containing protein [Candidatus Hydrogenedentes bacterium]|nr:ATP-binding cassette domain-containing protein [Candidatus Hydrogenedentota bacterium]
MITPQAILSVQNIVRSFGAQPVIRDISLTVHEGDRIGLIGRNGSGKSTLLKIMAGQDQPDAGLVTRRQGLRVHLLDQQCRLDPGLTIGKVLEGAARDVRDLLDRYNALSARMASLAHDDPAHDRLTEELAFLQHEVELADAWHLDEDIKRVTVALNLPPHDRVLSSLSGGELRRVDLAANLVRHPDVLFLDEPTNHIDVPSVRWMEDFLSRYEGSCVLVTHDRYFLDRVVNRIVELEHGTLIGYEGNYERFLELKAMREEHEARSESNRLSTMRRELVWLRRGPKARSTKQKARIDRYYELEEQGPPEQHRAFSFEIPQPQRLGKQILEAQKLWKKMGERLLFRDLSLIMQKDMRVGLIGPNGSGKTTLLRVLMGDEPADRGHIIHGENTQFLYVDQSHEEINPENSILKHVSNGVRELDVNGRRVHVPAYLEAFLFDRAAIMGPMKNLSGGERNRLDIAKKLLKGGNFLVFDEPTNDLDLATLRVLEESILAFDGCALIVSHDRYFLNRVCTHLFVFEGDGEVVFITGNYDDYLIYKERQAEAAPEPAAKPSPPPKAEKPAPAPGAKPRRLSWKERKELEGMEDAIHAAEAEVDRLETLVNDPTLYQRDYKAAQEAHANLEQARATVDHLYHRWQELEAIQQQ